MPDYTAVSAALATFKLLTDQARMLIGLSKQVKNAEFIKAITDLNLAVASANSDLAQVINENRRLECELQKARETIRVRPKMVRDGNIYKLAKPIKGYGDGPFCLRCFDVDGILVNVMLRPGLRGEIMTCPECRIKRGQ